MSIEVIKDVLKIEKVIGSREVDTLVETEIYLSPPKGIIDKILWTEGQVESISTKILKDQILVSGVVKFNAVYNSAEEEDTGIYTIEHKKDFVAEIDIENINQETILNLNSHVMYIQEEILDERHIKLRALVNVAVKVSQVNNIEIIKDIDNDCDLQVLKETVKYKEVYGKETSYAIVKEAFEISESKPSIEEILKVEVTAYEQESTVVDSRIIVSGMANAKILYYGEHQIVSIEEQIPFNHFLEIPEAMEDHSGEVKIEVIESNYEVLENDEGQLKIIDIEGKLKISGSTFAENEKKVLVDCYSTKEKVKIATEEVNVVEVVNESIQKEHIVKDLSPYNIGELYYITGKPTIIDTRILQDEVAIEGILSLMAIYNDKTTQEVSTLREEIPYGFYLPIASNLLGASVDVEVILENIKGTTTVAEAIINHKVKIDTTRNLKLISSIEETADIIDKRNRPSIIIYIVQKNDTLWDIAKRYNTTVEELLLSNDHLNVNNIMAGEKIIIEKIIDISF